LSVAKTSNLKRVIKEAWVDQSNSSQLSLDLTSDSNHSVEQQNSASHDHPGSHDVVQDRSSDPNQSISNTTASSPNKRSCFITQVNVGIVGTIMYHVICRLVVLHYPVHLQRNILVLVVAIVTYYLILIWTLITMPT